jgi:hypothetical protein
MLRANVPLPAQNSNIILPKRGQTLTLMSLGKRFGGIYSRLTNITSLSGV